MHCLLDEELVKENVETVETLLQKIDSPELRNLEIKIDTPVRMADANRSWIEEIWLEHAVEFQDSFDEAFATRFTENTCKVTKAFMIFLPQNFPENVHKSQEEFKTQLRNYGNEEMEILLEWYGKQKTSHGKTTNR